MTLTLGQIADWIHAEGDFDSAKQAVGYSIDSRTLNAGELFFAVKGERVDGHDYVETAIANGAVAAVVSMRWLAPAGFDECALLRVPDECDDCVLEAMQTLARRLRQSWGGRVIGITGSAGKTTTKECVAQVLAAKFRVLKTEGNFNNHFGLPLTLLRLQPEHEVAVLEMGMNHAGEIRALARIAEPDWAVVSNVGPVHLEHFSDGIEGIARAKRELVEALPEGGVAFLNADDERVRGFGSGLPVKTVLYGTAKDAVVRAEEIVERGLEGTDFVRVAPALVEGKQTRWPVHLHLPGRHNVLNALAAFAVAHEAGVDAGNAVAALEELRPTEKRGNILHWRGATIVNDTYNSNPKALEAMVHALMQTPAARRVVIAGEMLELGPEAAALHADCGASMAMAGVDVVVGVRSFASELADAARQGGVAAVFVATPAEAGAWMAANLRAGDVVLLKASRGVRLEGALDALAGEV